MDLHPHGLVPDGTDDCSTGSPFLYLALSTLGLLGTEPAVRQFTGQQPELLAQIRALSTAVSAAGARVRDAGLLHSDFDDRLRPYTADEIWLFDLAIDVIAMLGGLADLSGGNRARVASDLRSLDQSVHSHTWRKGVRHAGEGPAPFRALRGIVPHHTPHPARTSGGSDAALWM
jgi:hypothetical protein